MNKDNLVFLGHILERASKIVEFTKDMTEDDFVNDEKTQSAVIRELEVIGEASKRISTDFRDIHTEIPWKLMTGMRDILIHDYDGVDSIIIWNTIQNDIPDLINQLKIISGTT